MQENGRIFGLPSYRSTKWLGMTGGPRDIRTQDIISPPARLVNPETAEPGPLGGEDINGDSNPQRAQPVDKCGFLFGSQPARLHFAGLAAE